MQSQEKKEEISVQSSRESCEALMNTVLLWDCYVSSLGFSVAADSQGSAH